MNRNNIRLALRLIFKHKNISIINIIGMSVSLACALLILLWVQHELSYDRFHDDYKNICRVEENQFYSSNPDAYHVNVTPIPAGPTWKEEIPEIIDQCRIGFSGNILLKYEDQKYFESTCIAADSSFFEIFSFKLLEGQAKTVLNQPNTVVISEKIAKKYFGNEPAMGKVFKVDNDELYTVSGIMKNPPKNSSLPIEIIFPWFYRENSNFYNSSWNNNSIFTFVKTEPNVADTIINRKITEVTNIHKEDNTILFEINPIHRLHLHAYFGFGKSPGAVLYVYIFSAIALFILIIACINFMNMSTARSSLRAKEIGIRKVSGATKKRLMRQYLTESMVQTFISVFLALIILILTLNKFNDLSGKDISLQAIFSLKYIAALIAVATLTGLFAGFYPAFYLSSVKPVRAIKEHTDSRKGNGLLRKGLVIFQFSLSILLIAGTMIVGRQLNYMRNAELGFNKEHLINISLMGGLSQHYNTLKSEFLNDPKIKSISACMSNAYQIGSNSSSIHWEGKDEEEDVLVSFTGVDADFSKTMEININKGRGFSIDFPGDYYQDTTANYIINQTLADIINKDEIIGMDLSFMGIHGKIVGIMDDYNYNSLKNEVAPLAIIPMPTEYMSTMLVKLNTEDLKPALEEMENSWNELVSDFPFQYSFVDEEIDNMYQAEERMTKLMSIFTVIASIIACMGLFALSSFTAERRTREIGVRKTFGAEEQHIIRIMLIDTGKLIFLSLLIGLPAIWFIAQKWLEDFSFRIDLKPDIFIIASLLSLLVSTLTVIYHAVRSSRINPVEALKWE